jgi:hypothetical protein
MQGLALAGSVEDASQWPGDFACSVAQLMKRLSEASCCKPAESGS